LTTHSIVGGIVGASVTLGIIASGAASAFSLVQWGKIGSIALSWVLLPVLGGIASYILFFNIKKFILQYNEQAKAQLKVIKEERKRFKEEHKSAFDRLTELQQISYTQTMPQDASLIDMDEALSEDDFESDYYKRMHRIEKSASWLVPTRPWRITCPCWRRSAP
jgi:PiT family inorganic phosphate transporter